MLLERTWWLDPPFQKSVTVATPRTVSKRSRSSVRSFRRAPARSHTFEGWKAFRTPARAPEALAQCRDRRGAPIWADAFDRPDISAKLKVDVAIAVVGSAPSLSRFRAFREVSRDRLPW